MTKPITDGSTAVAEAIGNKFIFGDGYTGGIYALLAYEISYGGASWSVNNSIGSDKSYAAIVPTWVGADNRLDVDISALTNDFVGTPAALVSALAASATGSNPRYQPQARATSATVIAVRFVDLASGGSHVATESTKMAFTLYLFGRIA